MVLDVLPKLMNHTIVSMMRADSDIGKVHLFSLPLELIFQYIYIFVYVNHVEFSASLREGSPRLLLIPPHAPGDVPPIP